MDEAATKCPWYDCGYYDAMPLMPPLNVSNYVADVVEELPARFHVRPSVTGDDYLMAKATTVRSLINDEDGAPVDFVLVLQNVHCATYLVVREINRLYGPRTIWLLVPQQECPQTADFGLNVRCIKTRRSNTIYQLEPSSQLFVWQLLAAEEIQDLSNSFVVWDARLMPMHPSLRFFAARKPMFVTQPEVTPPAQAAEQAALYSTLLGQPYQPPALPGRNWLTYFAVMNKRIVARLQQAIEAHASLRAGQWLSAVISALHALPPGTSSVSLASLYASFVHTHYRHAMFISLHEPVTTTTIGFDATHGICCLSDAVTSHRFALWEPQVAPANCTVSVV